MEGWRGRRVLVTGADGFIGSHLVERLVAEGASVRAFVLYNSLSRWGWLEPPHVPPETLAAVDIFPGDIRDPRRVADAVDGCEVVFHLASLIAIPYSYLAPQSFIQTNVGGAVNVLEASLRHGVRRVVHTSTSEVYGTARLVPIPESHPLQPQSPYSASKIGADAIAQSYFHAYGLPVTTVRPFNTYGPRQSARAVIPTILCQLLSGAREIRLGALEPTRDFTYVSDTVEGFLRVAACDRAVGQVVNIGSGTEVSIGDLFRLAVEVTGIEAEVRRDEERLRPASSEVERLCCDATRAREWTGFSPSVPLKEGLARTSRFLAAHLDMYKTGVFNV